MISIAAIPMYVLLDFETPTPAPGFRLKLLALHLLLLPLLVLTISCLVLPNCYISWKHAK